MNGTNHAFTRTFRGGNDETVETQNHGIVINSGFPRVGGFARRGHPGFWKSLLGTLDSVLLCGGKRNSIGVLLRLNWARFLVAQRGDSGEVAAASRALVLVQNPEITMIQASALNGKGGLRASRSPPGEIQPGQTNFCMGPTEDTGSQLSHFGSVVEGIPAGMVHHLIAPALLTIIPAG